MSDHDRKKLMIVTGEASGDHHGALVAQNLKKLVPDLQVSGVGGDELHKAGMQILYHSRELSVVGLLEVLSRSSQILKAYRLIRDELRNRPPSLLMLIDYPEFNLRIAGLAKKCNVPVLYYISPQLWAWRRGRAKKIARLVDKMAVIFPFEVSFYEKVGLDAEFVGHPLLDQDHQLEEPAKARARFGLKEKTPVIGLLPGSRSKEIEGLLPTMLSAAKEISKQFPEAQYILPVAPGIDRSVVQRYVDAQDLPVALVDDDFYQVLDTCDLALVASGTATLQCAIMETPMVILYKVFGLTYLIGRLLIRVDSIGLANIVAGKKIVPELIQHEASPDRLAGEAIALLQDPERYRSIKSELGAIKKKLGSKGASLRVAEIISEMLGEAP